MKESKLTIAMGYIDDGLVSDAADYRPRKKTRPKAVRWLATAACFALVCVAAFQIVIDFTGNQSVDIYRVGECKQLESIDFLIQNYSGDLLLDRLNLDDSENTNIELYYSASGNAENTEDWYSAIVDTEYADYSVSIYALFDGTKTVEDWKVSSVFTENATKIVTIAETEVQIAPNNHGNLLSNGYYAIFEYEDVIYEVRVTSNDIQDTYSVLNQLLIEDRK